MLSKKFIIGFLFGGVLGLIPGFMLGVYFLPILTAEEGASVAVVEQAMQGATRMGTFRRDLLGSDFAHWGEGVIIQSNNQGTTYFTLKGKLAPGPDYKLYLTPRFVETEAEFLAIKSQSVRVANIMAYENFRVAIPSHVNADDYPALIVWCERFREFITAAELN